MPAKKKSPARREQEPKTVAAVERALDILDAFENGAGTLTLAELSRACDLYKSTILRLTHTLTKRGYLFRTEDGRYQVGVKPFLLGARYQQTLRQVDVILPVLKQLAETTRESASYIVRRGEFRVCVYRIESPQIVRDHLNTGDVRPLNHGAAGHVLAAFNEPPDPKHADVRRTLVATSFGEIEKDMAGIAVPLFDPDGRVTSALSLAGPRSRFDAAAVKRFEKAMLEAALRLTRDLGGDTGALRNRLDRLR